MFGYLCIFFIVFTCLNARTIENVKQESGFELAPVSQCVNVNTLTPTVYFKCGNIPPCTRVPCEVYANQEVYMIVNFTAPNYLEDIKPELKIRSSDFDFPFDIGLDNACDGIINTMCPIVQNEPVSFKPSFVVPNIVPDKMVANFQLSLIDKETQTKVFCFTLDFKVLSS